MINLSSFDLLDWLNKAYTAILTYISTYLHNLGLDDQEAMKLSPIVLLFLAVFITYLTSHMFTALRKYVLGFIILFGIIILASVILK